MGYEEAGSGPPVLMVHGLFSAPSLWAGVAGVLADRFRVIRCDLSSGALPRHYGRLRESGTEALLALIDWLDLPAVHLVGHGSGCPAVATLAARAGGRVRTLSVVDPIVPRTDSTPALQEAWHLENLLQWLSVGYGNWVRRPEHIAAIQQVIAQQTHGNLHESPGPFPLTGAGGIDMACPGSIACPVLALTGENSSAESKTMVGAVFGSVPHLRWAQVPGAGRHSPREAPAATARLLQQFLEANG